MLHVHDKTKDFKKEAQDILQKGQYFPFTAVGSGDVEELSHLARISEVDSIARNRNEIFWFYSFLWIFMLPF